MMNARLFIRNDDVWKLDRKFRYFFDLAVDRGLPVVYAVIPGRMEKGLVRFLCRCKERMPHLLDIVQHGWTHANHAPAGEAKYEFGPLRSLESQHQDIKEGQKKMRLAFGKHFTPAFVPPYHGYDQRTLQVLDQEGFGVFSAGASWRRRKRQFIEIPVQISFSHYEREWTSIRSSREMLFSLMRQVGRRPLSGVLTHHADFSTAAARGELERFFDVLAVLKAKKKWQVLLFSDILQESGKFKERP